MIVPAASVEFIFVAADCSSAVPDKPMLVHGSFAGLPSIGTAGCMSAPPHWVISAGPFLLRSISPRRALRAGRGCG